MKKIFLILFILSLIGKNIYAGEINIFAASNLSYVFDKIVDIYKKKNPDDRVKVIYASSGKGFNQIVNGAPFDIFFSANMSYAIKLYDKGYAITKAEPYVLGRIVLWTRKDSGIDVSKGLHVLLDPEIEKIAVANWDLAPYGQAAKECLIKNRIFEEIRNKIVIGENITKTAQYVEFGAADIGFIALSLAKSKKLKEKGKYYLIPSDCHSPIKQGYVVLKHAEEKNRVKTVLRFINFLKTEKIKELLKKYGYEIPE
ncbi:molybdate ABC transporter substrate-binding protein [Persephonella sp.]